MEFYRVVLPLLFFSFLSICPFVANSSSPLKNITIGSSLSTTPSDDSSTYWLSPSGNFAFGFYPVPSKDNSLRFIVGIWMARSPKKSLVWVANRDDLPFSNPSSILFSEYGTLVRVSGAKEIALLGNVQEPASYAMILDNGNLVLYNSKSLITWESFDYPTDTILPGQTLKSESSLISRVSSSDYSSGSYSLRIEKYGNVNVYNDDGPDEHKIVEKIYSSELKEVQHIQMNLDSNGHIYLVDQNGLNIKNMGKERENLQDHNNNDGSLVLYRATLDSDGIFRLYREKIGSQMEDSWRLTSILYTFSEIAAMLLMLVFALIVVFIYLIYPIIIRNNFMKRSENDNVEEVVELLSHPRTSNSDSDTVIETEKLLIHED